MKIEASAPARNIQGFAADRPEAAENKGAVLNNLAEQTVQRLRKAPLDERKQPVADMKTLVRDTQTFLEFSLHEDTGTIMVKVRNRDTKEVIREIPPEKILDLVAALWDVAGLMVDERV